LKKAGFAMAADSRHPIQPLLIGDPEKTQKLVEHFFQNGILATAISYPVVPRGRDEIRIQLSAAHLDEDIKAFLTALKGF
jgi:glycine C-acetyltransferase